MGPFIPNLSSITAPLREILKKKNTFEWNENYQRAFDEVKQAISEEITLNYFDSTKEVVVKHLTSAPPRLQRMLLRLQPYDLTIKYIPGKDMLLADALSRLSPEEKNPVKDMNVEIHEVCPHFSSEMIEKVKLETTSDQELMMLKTTARRLANIN
ncbi:Hypothetical predicted protein [Paramuricea clavata]|uniref:Uncharacterized protein n=1 Tax=Paramuricea clavata TaxID=317549 RepID=A0A6S7JU14_PARCT|nr:Hypothetical predicted protein [Paramuricea clavata]